MTILFWIRHNSSIFQWVIPPNLICVICNINWTDCIIDGILKNFEIVKFITTELKSILKLQSLVVKCCKMKKISSAKFANFVYFCITHRKLIPLSRKRYQFFVRTKRYKICKLHRVIFFTFYNISQPNFAILLRLRRSLMLW